MLSGEDDPSTNLLEFVEEAVAFIRHVEEVKGRVFVHCVAGVSRSVSFVLFHLMTTHRIPLKIAYQHVKTARYLELPLTHSSLSLYFLSPFIHPNEGFKVQLANYEVSLFGSSSVITNAGKDWDFYEWNRYS
jgi:atypical dual specificity phosphatase